MTQPLAIYIHWPFCQSKCPYCDFNSFVGGNVDHAAWRAAYRRELEHYAALLPDRRVTSVFFGGGTPSLMEPETVADVLATVARLWTMDGDVEITLEANPGSSEAQKFAGFRGAGVNRLSLGVQALNDADLKFLGRAHSVAEARRAIDLAQKNFARFSFDLIYARRDQTAAAWEAELREALTLADGHLSLYQLTIEPNTAFFTRANRGEVLTADENPSVAMYELTQDIMRDAGRPAYEISNHARSGQESRHNLTYWHYEDYIGIGPGAHGRYRIPSNFPSRSREGLGVGQDVTANPIFTSPPSIPPASGREVLRIATDNHRAPDVWMRDVMEKDCGLRQSEELTTDTAMREALMMGLRLVEGIDLQNWMAKFGVPMEGFLDPAKIRKLQNEAYIAISGDKLAVTASGLQRLNPILGYLLS